MRYVLRKQNDSNFFHPHSSMPDVIKEMIGYLLQNCKDRIEDDQIALNDYEALEQLPCVVGYYVEMWME